jgi:hypothetical protein
MTVQLLSMNTFLWNLKSFTLKTTLNFIKKNYVMDKSGYDFRIQPAEIDKEDIKYFKQWKHCRPVLLLSALWQ